MIYRDYVYGKVNISDPIIIEIINSNPVQRLKNISQHGPSVYNKYYTKRIITRFEHSVGVYLLLKRFSVSVEEQVAGLLHDVGHTVFSHAIDFLFPEENSEYDKKYHRELINKSDIPLILKKYHIDLKKVLNDNNFPIMEKPLPDLCADRIDYFLRDPYLAKNFNTKDLLNNLIVLNRNIVFKNRKIALSFADNYMKINELFWANPFEELLYFIMVDVIKIAFEKKIIQHEDLFLNEKKFLEKLKKSNNKDIFKKLKLLKNMKREKLIVSGNEIANSYLVKSKIRIVDPLVLDGKKLKRLSFLETNYKKSSDDFYNKQSKERWVGYEK
ncbi:hypothetical protein COS74_00745 [bacterium CG06_land_8_20_14_3_00_33_50]|nr:MAG: hypothetical protein AUJ93_04995 [bacterium CG2_30_33_46]PIR67562.1 MAG: hypothetical protein COU50_02940 [bacterium CG10_big_fil_rev_8_21_14_0_10_33_18]PIU77036.1 MAG: hypothetical protein COS74_00745 [bacterium CG06_land_8_20_14_3_00_33_50]PIW81383.1 MAG: hypothetical protein COZ97_01965 [bacterium CG_4_8_14_3_um_filter_33_28]PIY85348.1 MAG: hypothetical protein COY76_02770 [bacterium CG_4_10_14_0_8_um_filter_33_57]PJA71897.1 MAG: hypothetical protein CO152_04070 [bacterium CG_4_9_14